MVPLLVRSLDLTSCKICKMSSKKSLKLSKCNKVYYILTTNFRAINIFSLLRYCAIHAMLP